MTTETILNFTEDRFQRLTGYQNALISIFQKQMTLMTFINSLQEHLFGVRFYSTGRGITIHDRHKLGKLHLQLNPKTNIRYLGILYNSADSINFNKRIPTGQIFAQCKLANSGMNDYKNIFNEYNWIEFLDYCQLKYQNDRFELLCEYINFKYC
jgi:hypothetical protein